MTTSELMRSIRAPTGERSTRKEAARVDLSQVAIAYDAEPVLSGLDMSVEPGEVVAVIAPSGGGKSSILRLLAGFLSPAVGTVSFDGEVVADSRRSTPPEQRSIGFVFQNFALWPHMSVRENVAYPWKVRKIAPSERNARADLALAQVGLSSFGDRKPSQLSGGQQQRVALARALMGEPRLLLLDEPLSSVDAALRDELQSLILDLVHERGLTTIVATHDQQEAMTLADRIVVLGNGTIVQCGTPLEVYEKPANGFVAKFMGALNLLDATLVEPGGSGDLARLLGRQLSELEHDVVVVRPEQVRLVSPTDGAVCGVVTRSTVRGGFGETRVRALGFDLRAFEPGHPSRSVGELVGIELDGYLVLPSEAMP